MSTVAIVLLVVVVILLFVLASRALQGGGVRRHQQDVEALGRRDAERQFRKPPDEGGLL